MNPLGWLAIATAAYVGWRAFSGPRLAQASFLKLTDVDPKDAVLVPQGLVASGEVFRRPWSTVVSGAELLRDIAEHAAQSGYDWREWQPLYTPMTTGDQNAAADLDLAMVEVGFLTLSSTASAPDVLPSGKVPLFSGVAADSPLNVPLYDVKFMAGFREDKKTIDAVHGVDFGLSIFPPALPRPHELRAWAIVNHLWRYGGPLVNRDAVRSMVSQVPAPGVAAVLNSPLGTEYSKAVRTDHRVLDRRAGPLPGQNVDTSMPIGSGDQRYLWVNYLLTCCHLASFGFLSRPGGDLTVPRLREKSAGGGLLGAVGRGIGQTFVRYPDAFIGAALGSPKMFGKAAIGSAIKTLAWMGAQASATGDRVPWMEDWAPVMVARHAIGTQATDKRQYHTFGAGPQTDKLPEVTG